ncbi:hypothetical protein [Mycolicibacter virginiensis]|uniref:Uncharacterized protein n=1 Tax=Mycolicibacter virginiensis TaxID=1795032 RepID=A0A9X7IRQ9_9MYCO|nr:MULTISPECIES: hypothetical protein [Mycobacteriaceae]PQM54156.1 hypothetical protein C5U48_00780 [Mycolicibacter virginiensis]ULP47976.1 hypothetical protein MJO54_02045 [Mycolicibacter virginiensis]
MTSGDAEASDADLAAQAAPVPDVDDETPGPEISAGDHANIADVVEQHRGVPTDEDDYDR